MKSSLILSGFFCTLFMLLKLHPLYAQQGLIIPSTTTINVNTGTLTSNDDIVVQGTLTTTTGWVRLHGDWVNTAGTYTPNTGTLDFNGTTTQSINSGGTATGKLFYNFLHSGAGTLSAVANDIQIDNDFSNTNGTVGAGAQDITIEGNWANSAAFDGGTSTVIFDGTSQNVVGSTTFNNILKSVVLADTMVFDHTGTQAIEGTLEMHGTLGQLLTITSNDDDASPSQWGIALQPAGLQRLHSLNVRLSDASDGLTLFAGVNSIDLGLNDNWVFGGGTLTWDGDVNTDWNVPGNWDLGFVPTVIDTVIIPGAPVNQPILNVNVQITEMQIQSGATVSMNGLNLDITGTLSNDGTLTLFGNETLSIATHDTDSGNIIFTGDGDVTVEPFTLPDFGSVDYFNLVINDTHGTKDIFETTGTLTTNGTLSVSSSELDISTNSDMLVVNGTLLIDGGTLTATSGNIDANDDVVLTAGTIVAPNITGTFDIAGNFNHSTGGTFTHSSGIVNFNGTNQGITGNIATTFSTLRKVTVIPDSFTFSTTSLQTISGTLQLEGTLGNILSLVSDTFGVQAPIALSPGGVQILDWLSVLDNDASAGLLLAPHNSSEAIAGTTTNWDFDGADIIWEGDVSSDWNDANNWNLGIVPTGADHAIIPPVAGFDPILTSPVGITELSINSGGATVNLDGFNLAVSGTLSNDGTLTLFGNETYTFGLIDSDSGQFIFQGDGDGTAETFLISDLGLVDFFNVVINDTNGVKDTFSTTGSLAIDGTLNVTSGTLNSSTLLGDLNITGSLIIDGGTMVSTNGNIDVNGGVLMTGGSFTAPGSGQSFLVAQDWTFVVGGTFIHNGGDVTFDSPSTSNIIGETRFNDFTSSIAGKSIIFESGTTQTIEGSFEITGAVGNETILRPSITATQFFLDFPTSVQRSQFVNVDYSTALSNSIYCYNCIENTAGSTVNWIFAVLEISIPVNGETTDTTPTIIGFAGAGATVIVRDGSNAIVGTTVADANGNFRFEVTGPLPPGPISLTPFVGTAFGSTITFTISAAPTTSEQPTISTPADNSRLLGPTPTITGFGEPSAAVVIQASDANGNLLLQTVGTGTVSVGGTFSIQLTTALPKGSNYVSVTISGVATDIFTYSLTDPYGVVFDSTTNTPIANASVLIVNNTTGLPGVPGVDLDAADVNPVVTGTTGYYAFLTINDDFHLQVTATSYDFPSQLSTFDPSWSVILGSKGEIFTVSGTVLNIDLPLDQTSNLLRIEKDANKREVRIGDIVTYTISIENTGSINAAQVYIHDRIPAGFKYVRDRVLLDGVPIENPSGNRPLVFNIGTVSVGQTRILKYQLVVGTGVVIGDYENMAIAKNVLGIQVSNPATETVTVILDPLFDSGTTIGKVFYDRNENGIQDPPVYDPVKDVIITEEPVPNVRIVMEDGTIVTTDREGRYNIPALVPGRHLFRLDERTLPDGTYLTTDKVLIVDITPGLLVKANFGIKESTEILSTEDSVFFARKVKVHQDDAKPQPRLHVKLFEDPIVVDNDVFVHRVEFRIFSNYAPFVETWQIEIVDTDVGKVVKKIEGTRLNIYDPVYWDGRDQTAQHIDPQKHYEYRLVVTDKTGKFDETEPQPISFRFIQDDIDLEAYKTQREEKRKDYHLWIEQQMRVNSLKVQTILIDGQTVRIDRLGTRLKSVQIMEKGILLTEIPITERHGLTAQEIIQGKDIKGSEEQQILEVILPKGAFNLIIQEDIATDEEVEDNVRTVEGYGEIKEEYYRPAKTYSKSLQIGDDQMFFVAMGDGKVGYTMTRGNVEPISQSDRYNEGFYSEGKLAYYLKGKMLGKYLITSSFDTQRERKEIFRDLDPDTYYPIYGDGSQLNYDATNTQGPLYALIEWDKSSAIWGNYNVGFEETEFGQFTRSLYGGKIDYESLSANKYGDAKSKVIAFRAKAQQRSAHAEFLATGGSLYFLRHKDVIEGSDKLTIQIRDKINGLVITSRDMIEGADYEMDYDSGRMIFWKPVPALVESYSIISNELLNGNLVYVVVDYEYEVKDQIDEGSAGFRGRQVIGENLIVGTTVVNEEKETSDYKLRATDATLRLGPDASITTEFAETESEAQNAFISTDGGLSFNELSTDRTARGQAYGIKGDARLFNRLGLNAYYKWIDNDFSTSATTSQQGKELMGFNLVYDLGENTRMSLQQDIQQLVDDGNLQTQLQVGANKTTTTIAQIVHETQRMLLTSEFKREVKEENGNTTALNIVAVRADYQLNERIVLFAGQQLTIGQNDWRTEVGISTKVTDKLTITFKEAFGPNGTATTIALIAAMNERFALTSGYTFESAGGSSATVGAITKLNQNMQLETNFGVSSSAGFTRDLALAASGKRNLGKDATLGSSFRTDDQNRTTGSADVSATNKLGDSTAVTSKVAVSGDGTRQMTDATVTGVTEFDEKTKLESSVGLSEGSSGYRASTLSIGGKKQVDERTETENKISFTESNAGSSGTSVSFGTKKKLTDDIQLSSARIFGDTDISKTTENQYGLSMVRDGKKLEGTLSKKYEEGSTEISRSNIFGLSGEIDDRWAISGKYERGKVKNLDGSSTERDIVSLAAGYAKKDEETGLNVFKSSTKLEVRFDDTTESKRQYLVSNDSEGQITSEFALSTHIEVSETFNTTLDTQIAQHKKFALGGAYRPIMFDDLNILGKYTYMDEISPSSQFDKSDIVGEKAQVISTEGIYDINDKWQLTEKFAYRFGQEKVAGFEFTDTHTWLMIHRLSYKIDKAWAVSGEYRMLTQREAEDKKRGVLLEVSRKVGEYAQMGVGYDFTDFTDDLTDLDYTTFGPFVRMTGKFYDQTPEEIERARQKWLEEKISRWAWIMVAEELDNLDSAILRELNDYFVMAEYAHKRGYLEESKQIYKDIITAGQMMHDEASEYIRKYVKKEDELLEMKALADQYYKNGQYDKAKKILEKILAEAQKSVVK
ncbi:MAG: DUF11 domain-containing protein [Candidatus Omnitrophica bacterium]|nr:DUF11 domain-containing protein [Candidatus Omnitrophota bacterium]